MTYLGKATPRNDKPAGTWIIQWTPLKDPGLYEALRQGALAGENDEDENAALRRGARLLDDYPPTEDTLETLDELGLAELALAVAAEQQRRPPPALKENEPCL